MPTTRISERSHQILQELALESGRPQQAVLDEALELLRRQRFWDQVDSAYQALKADPDAWQEELEERALWDGTLMDGSEEE